jgi:S-adenosylmethionine/arginine decarboxylase-like enzyme
MNVCIEARSFYVDTPGNEGLTGQIGLSTSHIAIHIWDNVSPALVQMDVYSCKPFDNNTIIKELNKWKLSKFEFLSLDRSEGFKIIGHEAS